ncbi:MAG TPA: Crp/Fnr family transcriptional regulator [Chitinophagales bacterium]|nr:Crp/Fnr family transcriptional regulator [Chitinophagales bacterium]
MEHQDFIELITKGIKDNFPNISYANILELLPNFDIQQVAKKQEVIKTGQYYGKIVFVISGLFRAYYKQNDIENTFWFREEFTVFASHRSILQNKPSTISYQALEDSVIACIDYAVLKQFADENSEVANSIIVVLESLVLELIDRVEEFISLNPEQRYQCFLDNHRKVVNRVPQQQLASYLGITPESFSRLKARMMTK